MRKLWDPILSVFLTLFLDMDLYLSHKVNTAYIQHGHIWLEINKDMYVDFYFHFSCSSQNMLWYVLVESACLVLHAFADVLFWTFSNRPTIK